MEEKFSKKMKTMKKKQVEMLEMKTSINQIKNTRNNIIRR
jgi:hypothetical protein